MFIAGINIGRVAVEELIERLREDYYFKAAATLAAALEQDKPAVGFTIRERTAVLDVLDDPPSELEQLRGVLMDEHEWRVSHGLVKTAQR